MRRILDYLGSRQQSTRDNVGSAYDIFEFGDTKSFLKRRESAAEMFCARPWWSFFKELGSWQGRGLGLSCCCAFELRTISTERELPY
jgi:hypothetical protein